MKRKPSGGYDHTLMEQLFMRVEKPGRYIGGEFNSVVKPDNEVSLRIAMAFPDIYDVGMSYHGFQILYEIVNAMDRCQAERVFAPWTDYETLLREHNLPLVMIESQRPLSEADIIGFTLQHELNYTNILNMLDLGGVPVLAAQRGRNDPLVIAGGHGAFNPEVMADFIDAFVIGDGEEALREIASVMLHAGDNLARAEVLALLAHIKGVYVPRFYETDYNPDGTLRAVRPVRPDIPLRVPKAVHNPRNNSGPVRPVVPIIRSVHNRFAVEIKRGCTVGCRFCHAGMITRPLRERSTSQLLDLAREGIANTGFEEISLLSLSSADYSRISELMRALRNEHSQRKVSISLPSLRINAFDVALADEINSVRKSGFTFAPEAGTERLRRVINKAVDETRLIKTLEAVLRKGWRTIKYYFMCGLPTETDDDLQGIADLVNKTVQIGRQFHGGSFNLNLSISPFVPKPHTPFQWHAQASSEEFDEKVQYVMSRINRRRVSLKKHDTQMSMLEGVLARGDRRLGAAIMRAWQLGCKFDNWHEHFRPDLWKKAFAETGINPAFFATRTRGEDELFPWDHIDAGVSREFLLRETRKAAEAETTPDCASGLCSGCAACDFKSIRNIIAADDKCDPVIPKPEAVREQQSERVQRIRFKFTKLEKLRFISHLDLAHAIHLVFRRSGLSLAYTQGFNPQQKIQFTPPLPLGFASESEYADAWFTVEYDPSHALKKLASVKLEGLQWLVAQDVEMNAASLETQIVSASYRIRLNTTETTLENGQISRALTAFESSEFFPALIDGKKGQMSKDLRKSVLEVGWTKNGETGTFNITISMRNNEYVNPLAAIECILDTSIGSCARVTRTTIDFTR
ncbi:MAG: TIGR03960 family B12-binding radical SAM protein [Candidatus Sumerlaeota bacterium]|nr:TIGR03960 family B12-binding radical SAM protein [Candidatus Sumerlaeota bacterium]